MPKLNMKKVAVAIACLLIIAPVSVAQAPQVMTRQLCMDGKVIGISIRVTQPGTYTFLLSEKGCKDADEGPRLIVPNRKRLA